MGTVLCCSGCHKPAKDCVTHSAILFKQLTYRNPVIITCSYLLLEKDLVLARLGSLKQEVQMPWETSYLYYTHSVSINDRSQAWKLAWILQGSREPMSPSRTEYVWFIWNGVTLSAAWAMTEGKITFRLLTPQENKLLQTSPIIML